MSDKKLIVFVKNPEEGKVKTRLAKTVGDAEALNIYRILIAYTREQLMKVNAEKEISYSEHVIENDEWDNEVFSKTNQSGNGLGDRMRNAFQKGFQGQNFERIVLIGSDCAELTHEIIDQAFESLDNVDVVIGPALDGGYYLIGMRKYIPALFDEIDWSTSKVFDQTLTRIQDEQASYNILKQLRDVDDIEDWEKVRTKLSGSWSV